MLDKKNMPVIGCDCKNCETWQRPCNIPLWDCIYSKVVTEKVAKERGYNYVTYTGEVYE